MQASGGLLGAHPSEKACSNTATPPKDGHHLRAADEQESFDAQMCGHEGRGNNEEHLHKDAQHKSRDSPVKQTNKQTRATARDRCRILNLSWR